MDKPEYLPEKKYRLVSMLVEDLLPEWSLNLIPEELLTEWEEYTKSQEYIGLTPEIQALNKKRPIPDRIEEWMTKIYLSNRSFQTRDHYTLVTKPHQTTQGATRTVCNYRVSSSVDIKKYKVEEADTRLGISAGASIAAKLKIELEDLRSWNRTKRLEPPRVGDILTYHVVDFDKVQIVNWRIAQELHRYKVTPIVQRQRTAEEVRRGVKEVYQGGYLYIEEIEVGKEPEVIPQAIEQNEDGKDKGLHEAIKRELSLLKGKSKAELQTYCKENKIKFKPIDSIEDLLMRIKAFAYEVGSTN